MQRCISCRLVFEQSSLVVIPCYLYHLAGLFGSRLVLAPDTPASTQHLAGQGRQLLVKPSTGSGLAWSAGDSVQEGPDFTLRNIPSCKYDSVG